MAKFRLTLLFVIFSVGIASLAVLVLNKVSADVGEQSLISLSTKLAETDARLIGGALEQMSSAEVADGDQVVTVSDLLTSFSSDDPVAVLLTFLGPEVLEPLNIVSMSLISSDGDQTFTIGSNLTESTRVSDSNGLARAFSGEVLSGLDRDLSYLSSTRHETTGDVVTTLVPIIDESGSVTSVMSLSRDMSAELADEIAGTRAAMLKVATASIGGLLILLLAFIVWMDVRIWRANRRLLDEQLTLADTQRDKQELARLNESKDRFISTVSHELKTPLTTIMGFSEIMRRNRHGTLDEQHIEYLETMRDAGWRLDLLINDMLDISRIESGRLTLEKTSFDISDFLGSTALSLEPFVAQRNQVLHVETDHAPVKLDADRPRLAQCISNLVTNASKYSREGSEIYLRSELQGDRLVIQVQDQGIGISDEDQRQLCSMFFRADNQQTRSQPGLGLGMFITSAIVESHEGKLSIESQPGVGTTMSIHLQGVAKVPTEQPDYVAQNSRIESRLALSKSA